MTQAAGYKGFSVERDVITIIAFNQPRVNVLSTPVLAALCDELKVIADDKAVRALVITGQGSTFAAGADIKEMSGFGQAEAAGYARLFHRCMNGVEAFPRPVIASVNGFALGGGCELVLACDMAVASDVAVFAQPELDLGIIPGAGGTQRLAARVGAMRAKELILTGRRVYAGEAAAIGLVNKVVSKGRLDAEVMELAQTIADRPVHCVEAVKSLVDHGSLEREIEVFTRMFSYDEQKVLMKEFLKKK
ncbi:MAG: enoyl-CoA hydratase/isomerase family protein [Deltaproteobacteria bacterium]|nr:enoyl-CoA hydratase/isomerase family protein [Deltaproteobacteria bacterium]